ncbi:MAG: type I glutamate--ammonia ligase [Gemmatimonadetes bacterium 13_1_40CM_70_11]|nr:MAG: type I glutamate--ammonia ligase [Gemmatimonadetes bacterium 13_1_40CM_70_11]
MNTTAGATARDILGDLRQRQVRFLLLQFTDLLGVNKAVEVPPSQFERALAGEVVFDGSALEGFARVEEADALLVPDRDTFRVFPWAAGAAGEQGDGAAGGGAVARLICDIRYPDGRPFEGCPRTALKRQIAQAVELGFTMRAGCEAEFFLFEQSERGEPTTRTLDTGSYFDLVPVDRGERARRVIVAALEEMRLDAEASHHEVVRGQHEIDLRHADPLTTADNLATLRFVVRNIALRHGLVATFMPKPLYGVNGSGMHTHQALFTKGRNAFHDPKGALQLSDVGRWYIGGLLRHALGYCAVTNPLVNSYKRLVPGFEAPVNVAWSTQNVSPLVRVPAQRGDATRAENRLPDPSANPYLALAVQLAAGLDGIQQRIDPGEPVNKNISHMSYRERRKYRIDELPRDLHEALDCLEKDAVIRAALGDHIYERFMEAKREEWQDYTGRVGEWEVESQHVLGG